MKGLVILAVILGILGAGIWLVVVKSSVSDQGQIFLIVMGNPTDPKSETIEFDLSIELGMATQARPRVDDRMNPMWDEWIDEHFEMRDGAGNRATATRVAHTLLIDENKVKHIPEFYIQYKLEKGKEYTLDVITKGKVAARYQYKFTAEPCAPMRVTFYPVKGK